MNSIIPVRWNILEAEGDFDPRFFERSPYRSWAFLASTMMLSLDVGIGVLIGTMVWHRMSLEIKGLYALLLAVLPIVWARVIRDHQKMRAWYAKAAPEARNDYPVRMASHLMTFAPHYLHLLVFILLLFLGGAVRRDMMFDHGSGIQVICINDQKATNNAP